MNRFPQQQQQYSHLRRGRDVRSSRRQLILLVSCLALAVGFILAARQQIVAVHYGYKIEELRREREGLLDDQKRLRVALEEHSSPAQLSQAARELGLQTTRASQIEVSAPREAGETRAGRNVFVGTAAVALRH